MRYKIGSSKNIDRLEGDNLLIEILKLREVEKPMELLNLSPSVLHSATLLRGAREAIELLRKHVTKGSNIHIRC